MKTKNIFKGLLTISVLFVGLTLNATLGSISVIGFVSDRDSGEMLSNVKVTSSHSLVPSFTNGTGLYSISGLSQGDDLTFSASGYTTCNETITQSSNSQRIDVEMTSSSSWSSSN